MWKAAGPFRERRPGRLLPVPHPEGHHLWVQRAVVVVGRVFQMVLGLVLDWESAFLESWGS